MTHAGHESATEAAAARMLTPMTAPDEVDLTALSPELQAFVAAERAARRVLEQELATLAEQNRRLEHLLREFRQALHGRKSEKLGADEQEIDHEVVFVERAGDFGHDMVVVSMQPFARATERNEMTGAKDVLGFRNSNVI